MSNDIIVTGALEYDCPGCCKSIDVQVFMGQWRKLHLNTDTVIASERPLFMCSASDLFHERNSIDDITMVLDSMYAHPQHKYIMLTKRPERIAEAFGTSGIYPQPNWWIGVSAENQQMFDKRYPYICQYDNTVVSVDPMLSKVEIPDGCRASWIIAGPETGAGKRPCNDAWIDNLEFECFMQGIPFFDKRDGQRTRQFAKGIK